MGVINELIQTVRDIASLSEEQLTHAMNRQHYSSIAQRSLEGTLQFPTIVSDSIDIETLQTVTKALEKQFASFTMTAITMNPFLKIKSDKDAAGYLKNFHRNMGTKGNLRNDVLNLISTVGESYDAHSSDDLVMLSVVSEGSNVKIVQENKEGLQDVLEGLNTESLNSMYIPKSVRQRNFIATMESKGNKRQRKKNRKNQEDLNVNVNVDNRTSSNVGGQPRSTPDNKLPSRVLVDNDVKKSNELVPTTIHVRTIILDKDGKPSGNLEFIAGIKSTMHPVSSYEMIDNLQRAVSKGGSFFKTLKLTSGEISFLKDYLLNLTELKSDARSSHDSKNKWWSALKRRQRLAKFKRRSLLPGDILPTASVVISIEEAEFLMSEHNIDVMEDRVVRRVMEEYFLISFTVVDVASGVVHFFFDGYNSYQTVTFSGLERGDVSGGVDFKDVMKLVQRV